MACLATSSSDSEGNMPRSSRRISLSTSRSTGIPSRNSTARTRTTRRHAQHTRCRKRVAMPCGLWGSDSAPSSQISRSCALMAASFAAPATEFALYCSTACQPREFDQCSSLPDPAPAACEKMSQHRLYMPISQHRFGSDVRLGSQP